MDTKNQPQSLQMPSVTPETGFLSFFSSISAYLLMAFLCLLCLALSVLEIAKTGKFDGMVLLLSLFLFVIGFIVAKKQIRKPDAKAQSI